MLDLKKWFNSKHYMRLWNVGPPGLLFSVAVLHGLHHAEEALLLKTFSLSAGWLWGLMTIVELDAIVLLVWVLFSLPPKKEELSFLRKAFMDLFATQFILPLFITCQFYMLFLGVLF